jgi:hypothetical protein
MALLVAIRLLTPRRATGAGSGTHS